MNVLNDKMALKVQSCKLKKNDKRLFTCLNNILKFLHLTYLQFCSYTPMEILTLSIAFFVFKKTTKAKNMKFSGLVIYIEMVLYLLLHSLHDCTFNYK